PARSGLRARQFLPGRQNLPATLTGSSRRRPYLRARGCHPASAFRIPAERVRDVSALMQTLARLGPMRLVALGGVGLGILAFFFYFTTRLATEDMRVLYSDLDPSDSSKIVTRLESLAVPSELSRDGTRIMVPASSAARLRMTMAEEGLPSGGSIGYELFDRTSPFGTTSFTQEINHLRALEGELARSIRTLAPIQSARVHLVLPR